MKEYPCYGEMLDKTMRHDYWYKRNKELLEELGFKVELVDGKNVVTKEVEECQIRNQSRLS